MRWASLTTAIEIPHAVILGNATIFYMKNHPLRPDVIRLIRGENWGTTASKIPAPFFKGTRLFVFIFKIDCNCFGILPLVDYLLDLNF